MTEKKILVIDDNEDILFMLRAMLEFKGYTVFTKDNTHGLEDFIQQSSPDLILMDMLLSGTDGCEVCKELKSNLKLSIIPVIMISAHPRAETTCLAAGANYFIAKPFEMNDLYKKVGNAIAERVH